MACTISIIEYLGSANTTVSTLGTSTPSVRHLAFVMRAFFDSEKFFIDNETPNYYHPGKSGRLFLNNGKKQIAAYFGEIHPNILKKIENYWIENNFKISSKNIDKIVKN